MSRPQKIIPPVKGGFQQIVNAIADGKGVKQIQGQPRPKNTALTKPPTKP